MKQPVALHHARFETLERRRLLAAGDLDGTFGVGGRLVHENLSERAVVTETVVQDDGKILIGGWTIDGAQYFLERLNADGSADLKTAGSFTSDVDDDSRLHDLTIIPDSGGKILAIGEGGANGRDAVLARFNANGTRDTTFGGGDGVVPIELQTFRSSRLLERSHLELQGDGKILVLSKDGRLSRYLPDGSPDVAFNEQGERPPGASPGVGAPLDDVSTVQLQPDGKILLGGFDREDQLTTHFGVARINADGSLDTSFGEDGKVVTPVTAGFTGSAGVTNILLLPGGSGKFLASGSWANNGFATVRYNADGSIDTTFGDADDGAAVIRFAGSPELSETLIDADGNIILIGHGNHGLAITRLTPDGQLDETFGRVITFGSGMRHVHSITYGDGTRANAAVIGADGKLLIAAQQNLFFRDDRPRNTTVLLRLLTEDDGQPSPITLDPAQRVVSIAGTGEHDILGAEQGFSVLHAHGNGFGRAFDVEDVALVSVSGGAGDDDIIMSVFGAVSAHVNGGDGSDRIAGGAANDTLNGNAGRDFIDGGTGSDLVNGNGGRDQLRGQGGADRVRGGAGNDYLEGNAGNDRLDGGTGADRVRGQLGDDRFFSTDDNATDLLFGNAGNDSLIGETDEGDKLIGIEID